MDPREQAEQALAEFESLTLEEQASHAWELADALRSLLSAPQAEERWDWGRDRGSHIEEDDYSPIHTTHRRRSAGPWVPVEEDNR